MPRVTWLLANRSRHQRQIATLLIRANARLFFMSLRVSCPACQPIHMLLLTIIHALLQRITAWIMVNMYPDWPAVPEVGKRNNNAHSGSLDRAIGWSIMLVWFTHAPIRRFRWVATQKFVANLPRFDSQTDVEALGRYPLGICRCSVGRAEFGWYSCLPAKFPRRYVCG